MQKALVLALVLKLSVQCRNPCIPGTSLCRPPLHAVTIDALTKKVAAEPLKDRLASTTAAGMKKVFQALGCRPTCTPTTAPSLIGSSRS